jgi:hypothetical protein
MEKERQNCKNVHLASISKDQVHIVSECPTSAPGWSTIQDKFDRHNIVFVHRLLRTLMSSKMDNSRSIQDFLTGYDE